MSPINRNQRFNMLFSADEDQKLRSQADAAGLTASDYIRVLVKRDGGGDQGLDEVLLRPLASYTVIHDRQKNRAIQRIDGIIPMPVGAEIELTNPNVSVIVTRVRLLADHTSRATLCLDVEPVGAKLPNKKKRSHK